MQKERVKSKSTTTSGNKATGNSHPKSGTRAAGTAMENGTHKPNRSAQTNRKQSAEDSRLKEFFIDELKDIYWAEQKLVKTLPKLQKAATSKELQDAFGSHLEETKGHVERLEKAFSLAGEKAKAKKCDAMEGITEEGSSVVDDTEKGTSTRDVALIMAGQKAEHYEIATYGGLIQIAKTLGLEGIAELLAKTLEEEKAADLKLTQIAVGNANVSAARERDSR